MSIQSEVPARPSQFPLSHGRIVERPRHMEADYARRFCEALADETRGALAHETDDRPGPQWSSIDKVARRLGMSCYAAMVLADDCAHDGLVRHDQSQHLNADWREAELPHRVALAGPGWALVRGK